MKNLILLVSLLVFSRRVHALEQCHFSSFVDTTIGVTASTQILGANGLRHCLLVVNKGAVPVYVTLKSTLNGSTVGIVIPAGGNWEPIYPPIDPINVIGGATTVVFAAQGQ